MAKSKALKKKLSARTSGALASADPNVCRHPEAQSLLRSDVGTQAQFRKKFFPRTGAWDDLKKSLKGEYEDSVWDHLAGTTSAPFEAGEHRQIAVKVIDDRGNELRVLKKLTEVEGQGR